METEAASICHSIFVLITFLTPRSCRKSYKSEDSTFSKRKSKEEHKDYHLFGMVRFTQLTVS
jgi:hypothetical protein